MGLLDTWCAFVIVSTVIVYAIIDLRSSRDRLLGDAIETFLRREDAERLIEQVRGDEPKVAAKLGSRERELDAGELNSPACIPGLEIRGIGKLLTSSPPGLESFATGQPPDRRLRRHQPGPLGRRFVACRQTAAVRVFASDLRIACRKCSPPWRYRILALSDNSGRDRVRVEFEVGPSVPLPQPPGAARGAGASDLRIEERSGRRPRDADVRRSYVRGCSVFASPRRTYIIAKPTTMTTAPRMTPVICFNPKPSSAPRPIGSASAETSSSTAPTATTMPPASLRSIVPSFQCHRWYARMVDPTRGRAEECTWRRPVSPGLASTSGSDLGANTYSDVLADERELEHAAGDKPERLDSGGAHVRPRTPRSRASCLPARMGALRSISGRAPSEDLERLGSEYGGYMVPMSMLGSESVCYSCGIGEDASFDLELIAATGCHVYAFDPTPRAKAYATPIASQEKRFHFMPYGIWSSDGPQRFYAPKRDAYVSHSIGNQQETSTYFEADCRSLESLMSDLGHDRIDLLKLDVEGAEYDILEDAVHSRAAPRIICAEFHKVTSVAAMLKFIGQLSADRYTVAHTERMNVTLVSSSVATPP